MLGRSTFLASLDSTSAGTMSQKSGKFSPRDRTSIPANLCHKRRSGAGIVLYQIFSMLEAPYLPSETCNGFAFLVHSLMGCVDSNSAADEAP